MRRDGGRTLLALNPARSLRSSSSVTWQVAGSGSSARPSMVSGTALSEEVAHQDLRWISAGAFIAAA